MTGPKHLWSGDWQQEPEIASEPVATGPVSAPSSESPPAPQARARAPRPTVGAHWRARRRRARPRRARPRRALPIAAAAVLVFIAVAFGLNALFGASDSSHALGSLNASPRPVAWLGMEIETVAGSAVIETVKLGSQGEIAGLEPGDIINRLNNRAIDDTGEIEPAIRGLHTGDVVKIQVRNGSTAYETGITLAAPPSAYP